MPGRLTTAKTTTVVRLDGRGFLPTCEVRAVRGTNPKFSIPVSRFLSSTALEFVVDHGAAQAALPAGRHVFNVEVVNITNGRAEVMSNSIPVTVVLTGGGTTPLIWSAAVGSWGAQTFTWETAA